MRLGDWLRRRFGRRRSDRCAPEPDPESLARARQDALRATEVLARTVRQNPAVMARERRADRLRVENNLGPAFMRYLSQRGGT